MSTFYAQKKSLGPNLKKQKEQDQLLLRVWDYDKNKIHKVLLKTYHELLNAEDIFVLYKKM